MPNIIGELRDWSKTEDSEKRDVFQGRTFNDITHRHRDGEFKTINAQDVLWNKDGCLVTENAQGNIWVLWNAHKREKKDKQPRI